MSIDDTKWPIFVKDKRGRKIYLTEERWGHALDHPGMEERLLDSVLLTMKVGGRKQEALDPSKYKYRRRFEDLPEDYTHVVVVVKFGIDPVDPSKENNFVLTAYLVREYP
ncbi:MAG: hypothetical protein ISS50_02535 [Anaerolineae bacterium]|nr:hypothetical protein [Anaerolineae bacterium]